MALGTGAATPAAPAVRAPMMRVDFDAPAGCSSAEAFRRGVAARLERAAASDGAPPLRIHVHLTRSGEKVVGELRLSHEQAPPDTRTVEGATCDEVVDVLALTTALALQPAARAAPHPSSAAAAPAPAPARSRARETPAAPPPAPRPAREAPAAVSAGALPPPSAPPAPPTAEIPGPRAPPSPPAPRSPPPPPPVPAPAPPAIVVETPAPPLPRNPAGMYLEVGAAAALAHVLSSSIGSGPGPNLGGGVMLGLSQVREDRIARSLRLGWLYLPNDFLLPGGDVVDRWYAFTLTGCPGWGLRHGAFDAQACARAIGGWLTATDASVTNPRSASRSWLSAGALLRGGAALGAGFTLEVEAGVDAPLFHRQFITTTPLQTVAETPPVSLLVGIGLSRRL